MIMKQKICSRVMMHIKSKKFMKELMPKNVKILRNIEEKFLCFMMYH